MKKDQKQLLPPFFWRNQKSKKSSAGREIDGYLTCNYTAYRCRLLSPTGCQALPSDQGQKHCLFGMRAHCEWKIAWHAGTHLFPWSPNWQVGETSPPKGHHIRFCPESTQVHSRLSHFPLVTLRPKIFEKWIAIFCSRSHPKNVPLFFSVPSFFVGPSWDKSLTSNMTVYTVINNNNDSFW